MDFDIVLEQALAGIRLNPSESAGHSPFFIVFGGDPVLPIDSLLGKRLPYVGNEFHKKLLQRNHEIYCDVFKQMTKSRIRRNRYANRKAQQVEFNANDPVYYINCQRTNKKSPQWVPY